MLLLCKHLTAFLVVVARQKQGGRASERAAASAAPESESAPETEGAAVHQILLRGGEQNRLLKTHHFLLKVSGHRSEARKHLHWCAKVRQGQGLRQGLEDQQLQHRNPQCSK